MKQYRINAENAPGKLLDHHDYAVYRDVRIPMRDGVELTANIFFPAKDGEVDFTKKYPVIMNRTPYLTTNGEMNTIPFYTHYYAADQGFVFALCGVRGTNNSGGEFLPMQNEGWGKLQDGVDTVAWLREQSWCDGHVVTCGTSYLGGTQYALQLTGDVPGLETSVIHVPSMNSFGGSWAYNGDFFDLECSPMWAYTMSADLIKFKHASDETLRALEEDNQAMGDPFSNPGAIRTFNFSELAAEHGLINIPIVRNVPFYHAYLDHRDDKEYFSYNDVTTRKHDMKKPLLFVAGWFDLFGANAIQGYELSVQDAPSVEVAKGHRLIIGPWNHTLPLEGMHPGANMDLRVIAMEWIKSQLYGVGSEFFDEVPVALYVLGENRWRAEKQWPLPDAQTHRLYLRGDGPANTAEGAGVLSQEAPGASEAADVYTYDPAKPIYNQGGVGLFASQADQAEVEQREDVLVFTSPALEEDLEVTGAVKASFFAATTGTDTDFFVRLVDVSPEGPAMSVITGGRRGRYVQNGRTQPTALVPGEAYRYEVEMRPTSYVFKKGHRIRVDICSNDAKFFDTNPNAFVDLNTATANDYVVAQQTVYHDAERPAYIELPVIPASHERNWIEWPFNPALFDGIDNYMGMIKQVAIEDPVFKNVAELPSTTPQRGGAEGGIEEATTVIRF